MSFIKAMSSRSWTLPLPTKFKSRQGVEALPHISTNKVSE